MSPEEQRIAIAEFKGLRWNRNPVDDKEVLRVIPDYPRDLNAMHEAEKIIKDRVMYIALLRKVIQSQEHIYVDSLEDCIFATASQRAEALLRTIGKWKD